VSDLSTALGVAQLPDPFELREVMDERLLDLCDDVELVGGAGRVVEVGGPPWRRVAQVLEAVEAARGA
jgi:hypothetical protein